jgi:hypothetical protein
MSADIPVSNTIATQKVQGLKQLDRELSCLLPTRDDPVSVHAKYCDLLRIHLHIEDTQLKQIVQSSPICIFLTYHNLGFLEAQFVDTKSENG